MDKYKTSPPLSRRLILVCSWNVGRSMLEMLGVLAVVGVLSIVGLFGLKTAQVKHNTNLLIEDVRLAGFIVVDEMFEELSNNATGINLSGKFEQKTSYTFKAYPETEETFEILVENVQYNVCEETKKREVEWLEEIKSNGMDNNCKNAENNKISFFFNLNLNGNMELETDGCRTNKDCPSILPFCRNGICSKCETGLQLTNGSCTSCPSAAGSVGPVTAGQCHLCGDNYMLSTSNICVECSRSHYDAETKNKDECARCPNRCWDEKQGLCLNSEEGNVFINPDGTCNYACSEGTYLVWSGSKSVCHACPETGNMLQLSTSATYCHMCGDNYIFAGVSTCAECTISHYMAQSASKDECARCPNRCWDEKQGLCLNSEEGNVFINPDGTCNYACSEGTYLVWSGSKSVCHACPETGNMLQLSTSATYCHMCGDNYIFAGVSTCAECTVSHYMAQSTSKEECARCPNRYFDDASQKCYLCPNGQKASADGLSCIDE